MKKLIIERLCYKPAAYEFMSVSKFTIEISKYKIIDKANLNRKRNFRISYTNIAIYYTTRRIVFVYYSILKIGCKLKYCSIDSSVEIYHRGLSNQFEKLV